MKTTKALRVKVKVKANLGCYLIIDPQIFQKEITSSIVVNVIIQKLIYLKIQCFIMAWVLNYFLFVITKIVLHTP